MLLSLTTLVGAGLVASASALAASGKPRAEVWKDEGCGCCKEWIKHLQAHGFDVTAHDGGNTAKRAQLGLPAALGSCHTAVVGGYVIEGHVPAADIKRLLREKPRALGLAVPGMPIGSPGMDAPIYRGRKDRYDVLMVSADGSTSVYKTYP
jgi:hypothetical protein